MTSATDSTRQHDPNEPPAPSGLNPRVSLTCPKCGAAGWIKWSSLNRAIHCPQCQCKFLLARGGLTSLGDLPQVRFSCPRCGKSGRLPSTTLVRNAECDDCKLPLVAGPDRRLHSASEAARLEREAAVKAREQTHRAWLRANLITHDGHWRRLRIALAFAAATVVLGLVANAVAPLMRRSTESLSASFTYACLADDGRALVSVEDDPVQAAEFERFRTRHFASLLDKYRPAGDRVTVDAAPIQQTGDTQVFDVRLQSEFLGTRSHKQVWRQHEGRWWFDAAATLTAQDELAAKPPATLPGSKGAAGPATP